MRYLSILILMMPILSIGQKKDSTLSANAEKLSIWYRNFYQSSNKTSCFTNEPKASISPLPVKMNEPSQFLNTVYTRPNWRTGQPATIGNVPYYGAYLDPTGGATVGQLLLTGGINYILDKTVSTAEKKRKRKK